MTQRMPQRAATRPRYGRIATLGASVTVTLVAMLASVGILAPSPAAVVPVARTASYSTGTPITPEPGPSSSTPGGAHASTGSGGPNATVADAPTGMHTAHLQDQTALPGSSGSGRRIVFSQRLQRVWLVVDSHHEGNGVKQTHLVSGSVTHNLTPGTYTVYSRSRRATGVDDSGAVQYFVRFTQGPTGTPIGFYSIPTKNGSQLQTLGQLGTPQSHAGIRQAIPDAIALWHFAPVGTKVVVVP